MKFKKLKDLIFTYKTPRSATVRSVPVVVLHRLIQITMVAYVIGYGQLKIFFKLKMQNSKIQKKNFLAHIDMI